MDDRPRPTIGILGGTGPQGRGLGLRLALAGYEVVLGSRVEDRAVHVAADLRAAHPVPGELLTGAANSHAAARDVVIVTVPFDGVRPLLESLAELLAGKVVISCVNRLGFDADGPYPIPVAEGSAAELIAALVPRAQVFGAFHHIPAGHLTRDLAPLDMDVLVTGDASSRPDVLALVAAIDGARAVPAGPLRLTRPLEELTAVVISVNKRYRVSAGVRLTGLTPGG